jgi:hypothetical protein
MKISEMLRRKEMWWRRCYKSMNSSHVRRMNVCFVNYLFWLRRFEFHSPCVDNSFLVNFEI